MARVISQLGIHPLLLKAAVQKDGGPLAAAIRLALRRAGLFWWANFLKKHFKREAPQIYADAYTPRGTKYERYKHRRFPYKGPMWWSGRMRQTLLHQRPTAVEGRGRSVRVRIKLAYARAANLWSGKQVSKAGNVHNFHRELTATTREEREELRGLVQRALRTELRTAFERAALRIRPRRLAG